MPLIWCSISGHGFGHAAQVVPILNELGHHIPDLRILLRTSVPIEFFQAHLQVPWELRFSQQDIGCVQQDPLMIHIKKTWNEYERFHVDWNLKVKEEAESIRSVQPDLVISNISHFGIEAGVRAQVPTVALGSLSWDQVLENFVLDEPEKQKKIIAHIRGAFQKAQLMIRLAPGIPMVAFRNLIDVGPIASPALKSSGVIRKWLNMNPEEKLVLIAFGGIPLESIPVDRLKTLPGHRFLIGGAMKEGHDSESLQLAHSTIPFRQILAEADIVVTKPGYATVVEAVRYGIPIVYVRRNNFVDEQLLVDYAHQFGRAEELSIESFYKGDWFEALETVQRISPPSDLPPELGTSAAADVLMKFL